MASNLETQQHTGIGNTLSRVAELIPPRFRRLAGGVALASTVALGATTLTAQQAGETVAKPAHIAGDAIVGNVKIVAGIACAFWHTAEIDMTIHPNNPYSSIENCANSQTGDNPSLPAQASVSSSILSALSGKLSAEGYQAVQEGNGANAGVITTYATENWQAADGRCQLDARVVDSHAIGYKDEKVNGKMKRIADEYYVDFSVALDHGASGINPGKGVPNITLGENLNAASAAFIIDHSTLAHNFKNVC